MSDILNIVTNILKKNKNTNNTVNFGFFKLFTIIDYIQGVLKSRVQALRCYREHYNKYFV